MPYDLAGSRAHAHALHRAGLLTDADLATLEAGLDALGYTASASKTQIIALEPGDIRQTTALRDALDPRLK